MVEVLVPDMKNQHEKRYGMTVMERWMRRLRREDGAITAEYAIATMAAVGFAGLLVVILRSEEVRGMLLEVVRGALSLPG